MDPIGHPTNASLARLKANNAITGAITTLTVIVWQKSKIGKNLKESKQRQQKCHRLFKVHIDLKLLILITNVE